MEAERNDTRRLLPAHQRRAEREAFGAVDAQYAGHERTRLDRQLCRQLETTERPIVRRVVLPINGNGQKRLRIASVAPSLSADSRLVLVTGILT